MSGLSNQLRGASPPCHNTATSGKVLVRTKSGFSFPIKVCHVAICVLSLSHVMCGLQHLSYETFEKRMTL